MGRSWLCPLAAASTVARNWASSSGKLAVYSSFTMHMYSGLKVGLCSLYAARATNLLTRAEPMQRRILDWGREVVAVFQEGSENSILGG